MDIFEILIGAAVVIGTIVFIWWMFKKEVKVSMPKPFMDGLEIITGKLLSSGGKVKEAKLGTRFINALKRAGNSMRSIK